MVTARVAIGSVSTLAFGAMLLGSAPYWLNRGASHASPWGAISALSIGNPAAAASDTDKAQLLKLAALKSGTATEQPTSAPIPADPAPVAQMDPAPAPVAPSDAAQAPAPAAPVLLASAEDPPALVDTTSAKVDGTPKTGLVNINTASSGVLDHLPGVGRVGHAIVSHRPYKSVKDLVNKRVLRTSDFQKIQASVSVED